MIYCRHNLKLQTETQFLAHYTSIEVILLIQLYSYRNE